MQHPHQLIFSYSPQFQMAITSLEEKENRKLYVPIRPGNRGGWSLFEWESVRDMPYRDREMYLGNSTKIGILDKGGKWRKKDWFLHKEKLPTKGQLDEEFLEAKKKDLERMNTALGIGDEEDDEQLTPAEMAEMLRKLKMKNLEVPAPVKDNAIGLGFDKTKIQIRATPSTKIENPHRLEGTMTEKIEPKIKEETKKDKKSKKHKKSHRKDRSRSRSAHKRKRYRSESSD